MGVAVTEGLGAGSQPEVGRAAAEEALDEINDHLSGCHMVFITAGMGGGTGTGAAPVIARAAREQGILTVGVVTKPFHFEGERRMRLAEDGIDELQRHVDTLIVIPNQNLFRVANEKTTFADAFAMADQVLYSGVACITDLMVKEGLINLDFADVPLVMRGMGKAMMGTGEASGDNRAIHAAEAAIANPLLDDVSMQGARGLLISITGGPDLTLYEVDEAASRIREEVDQDANIILGATFDDSLEGMIRVSVVATGIDQDAAQMAATQEARPTDLSNRIQIGRRARPATARRPSQHRRAAPTPAPTRSPRRCRLRTRRASRPRPRRSRWLSNCRRRTLSRYRRRRTRASPFRPTSRRSRSRTTTMPSSIRSRRSRRRCMASRPRRRISRRSPSVRPAASRPRMPEISEFPAVAQREMMAAPPAEEMDEERRPMSLLRRIASVSLGRREDDHGQQAAPQPPRAAAPAPRPQQPVPQVRHSHKARRTSEFAKRPAPQQQTGAAGRLDPQGRVAPQPARQGEDDQLEIPAFLRRQT